MFSNKDIYSHIIYLSTGCLSGPVFCCSDYLSECSVTKISTDFEVNYLNLTSIVKHNLILHNLCFKMSTCNLWAKKLVLIYFYNICTTAESCLLYDAINDYSSMSSKPIDIRWNHV